MIPKSIYICHATKAIVEEQCVSKWRTLNPGYSIHAYGNQECTEFLKNEYGQLYVDIFNHIKDGPIKSDFWRLCILYTYGGVYADADIIPLVAIDEFLENDVQFATCNSTPSKILNPHLIVSTPKNILLKECIDTYIRYYTHKRPYEYWTWSIMMIMDVVVKKHMPQNTSYKEGKYGHIQIISQVWKKGLTLYDAYCSYRNRKILINKARNYDNKTHMFVDPTMIRHRPSAGKIRIPF